MIEAAETLWIKRSALGSVVTYRPLLVLLRKLIVPSIIISLYGVLTCSTARLVANLSAADSPMRSISSAGTQPKPKPLAFSRISISSASRFFLVSFLLSVSPSITASPSTTAPTTSGPAHGPLPTSSIPKIILLTIHTPSMNILKLIARNKNTLIPQGVS